MQGYVAIGAHGDKIVHGVNLVFAVDLAQRDDVVHLDDAREFRPVGFGEVEAADGTGGSVCLQACSAGAAAALVAIDGDAAACPLGKRLGGLGCGFHVGGLRGGRPG